MAVNQNHTENRRGAIIPYGESVLQHCHNVDLSFPQQPEGSHLFGGTKRGTLFLTSYRVIFVTSHSVSDPLFSFMMPFDLMSNCSLEQPVFAANYIRGTIQAAPDGGWDGQATFKLAFRKGGAIRFSQLLMNAASAAARGAPLRSVNYWFGSPGLFVVPGPGGVVCSQEMPYSDMEPHWEHTEPHQQDTEPRQQDTEPRQQDTEPRQQDTEAHLWAMEPHQQDTEPRQQDTEPHQRDTEAHLWDMEPRQQDTQLCLWDTELHQQDMEPCLQNMEPHQL
ncbi:postacrosomal sheath WW domain-binding protein [Glossophaga mutica]